MSVQIKEIQSWISNKNVEKLKSCPERDISMLMTKGKITKKLCENELWEILIRFLGISLSYYDEVIIHSVKDVSVLRQIIAIIDMGNLTAKKRLSIIKHLNTELSVEEQEIYETCIKKIPTAKWKNDIGTLIKDESTDILFILRLFSINLTEIPSNAKTAFMKLLSKKSMSEMILIWKENNLTEQISIENILSGLSIIHHKKEITYLLKEKRHEIQTYSKIKHVRQIAYLLIFISKLESSTEINYMINLMVELEFIDYILSEYDWTLQTVLDKKFIIEEYLHKRAKYVGKRPEFDKMMKRTIEQQSTDEILKEYMKKTTIDANQCDKELIELNILPIRLITREDLENMININVDYVYHLMKMGQIICSNVKINGVRNIGKIKDKVGINDLIKYGIELCPVDIINLVETETNVIEPEPEPVRILKEELNKLRISDILQLLKGSKLNYLKYVSESTRLLIIMEYLSDNVTKSTMDEIQKYYCVETHGRFITKKESTRRLINFMKRLHKTNLNEIFKIKVLLNEDIMREIEKEIIEGRIKLTSELFKSIYPMVKGELSRHISKYEEEIRQKLLFWCYEKMIIIDKHDLVCLIDVFLNTEFKGYICNYVFVVMCYYEENKEILADRWGQLETKILRLVSRASDKIQIVRRIRNLLEVNKKDRDICDYLLLKMILRNCLTSSLCSYISENKQTDLRKIKDVAREHTTIGDYDFLEILYVSEYLDINLSIVQRKEMELFGRDHFRLNNRRKPKNEICPITIEPFGKTEDILVCSRCQNGIPLKNTYQIANRTVRRWLKSCPICRHDRIKDFTIYESDSN